MPGRPVARVLLESPLPQLDRLFDYEVPASLDAAARPGVRVRVPLRSAGRLADGYIVERGEEGEVPRPLSELEEVVSETLVLPERLALLARRIADRAAGSAADVLRLVIPKRQVRVEKAWAAADDPTSPLVPEDALARAREALAAFPGLEGALEDGRRVAVDAPARQVEAAGTTVGRWAVLLAAAAVATLHAGRSAVLVVPDHRDQEQLEIALATYLDADEIVRWDARQSGPARYRNYLRALADAACIVVGNRSAVYAPVASLGLLAVWNDGDPLLDEPLAPYVTARDAALVRQESEGGALLFAGHTRSADVQRLVARGWVEEVAAARRVSPRVVLSAAAPGEGAYARIPSSAFRAARDALRSGPVLVQVSRPGYAPVLVCADCRTPARCSHCAGPLQVRRAGETPVCAWCGRDAHGWRCGACGEHRFRLASAGSERTADELGRAFPHTRVIVSDGSHPLLRVDDQPALVVATRGAEPIASGGYHAVLLLDGDRMLLADDLRIGEACVRWWSDAAALARKDAPVHLVGVVGPAARAVATWTQPVYAQGELDARAELRLPPAARTAMLHGTQDALARAIDRVLEEVPALSKDDVLGPVSVTDRGETVWRALIRFDYALGAPVATSLRSSVVAEAVRTRRPVKGSPPRTRNTLRVRLDDPNPDL